jgi:predicted small lipoprotein YifL
VSDLSLLSHRRLARIAALGALAAALGLAGCGRKAGLDPPPNASATDQSVAANGSGTGTMPDGKAAAPAAGPKRPTPIDWLIQ